SKGSFPLPLSSQVREPPAEPSARPVPAPYPDDPYVITRDAAIADAAIATSSIDDDDDDDTAPMDSQPHEPRGSPRDPQTMPPRKSTKGNPPPPLTQDTVNRMIQESVEAAIRAERERVQNEANRAEGPNVAPVARKCTFADFMKCSPITFRGNKGVVVKGDDCVSRLKVVSCMKVKKYVDRRSHLFVAQVVEKEPTERRLEDVPIICKFPDVFPEDLPGLPPPRHVEFEIELVPGAAPVARAPYRLAPSKMKELAK
nr:reverse transcriptase domain-containing protein [Tanacetum cinerariifolium]